MSISISPAITTTPVLDSLFPIYWEDLTDEEKQSGKQISAAVAETMVPTDEYTITITPTDDMYAIYFNEGNTVIGETAGAPINVTVEASKLSQFNAIATDDTDSQSATKIVIAIVGLEIHFN